MTTASASQYWPWYEQSLRGLYPVVEIIEYSVRAQKNREKTFKGLWWSDPTSTLRDPDGMMWRLLAPGPPWSLPVGMLVLGLALVATLGQLTRNVILTARVEPGHRNMPFWS